MVYEMLVGLHVTNDEMYQAYREKMTPRELAVFFPSAW